MTSNQLSESIFQKRIKRFKSMKRGYYSLIILIGFYLISLLGPLWMNNKAFIVKYNGNYYFPAVMDFLDFIPGVNYPLYKAETFNQSGIEADFRLLDKQLENNKNTKNFVIMPIYPYHPHEVLADDLDEEYIDQNKNEQYDGGEEFVDNNANNQWDDAESFTDEPDKLYTEGEEFTDCNESQTICENDGESFTDEPDKLYTEGEEFTDCNEGQTICENEENWDSDSIGNGVYDIGEPFVDTLGNGVYDIGEPFDDKNNNGLWDDSKWDSDSMGNTVYDIGEPFNDTLGNGVYDIGEPFDDIGNGIWDNGESFTNEPDGFYTKGEEFIDCNEDQTICEDDSEWDSALMGNGVYDEGEPFDDIANGIWDDAEKFKDINSNNKYDGYGKYTGRGEPFTDENGDGVWNENNPPTLPAGFGGRHLLGTDNTGRDVFTRLVDGYKISITFAIIVTTLGYTIGIIIGSFFGFYGGRIDLFGVRLMEIFSAMPFLFVMMILASFIKPNIITLAALSVLLKGWIGTTYFIRGEFYREKAKDYVSAAVSLGASSRQVMFKHILPNSLTPIITFAPFSIIGDIMTLVSLDFLGYGLRPPTSSWGNLLSQASENLDNWHMLIFPVILLTITIYMITFISEAVREAFDPRVYSRLQ